MVTDLTSLKNIGKEMESKLSTVGINSAEVLRDIGSKDVFVRLKLKYPNVCLVHLYTLQGAIDDVDYNRLSKNTKQELKEFCDTLK